jgi:uncharacterized protein (TIGR02453 family)
MRSSLFSPAISFFGDLEQDNSKQFWERERTRYEQDVKPVFAAVIDAIVGFGPWRTYRPFNDTRFQRDKDPYKTFIGAVTERGDGVGAFVQVSAKGVLVGTGIPMPATDQLPRLRAAIALAQAGADFETALATTRATGAVVHGGRYEPLKRVPKDFPSDHPRAEYLRWKGVEVNTRVTKPVWVNPAAAAAAIDELAARGDAVHHWIGRYVGPSKMTAEERFAPRRGR